MLGVYLIDRILDKAFRSPSPDLDISFKGFQVWKSLPEKFHLDASTFKRIQNQYGFDIASWVLYKYFKEKVQYKKFETYLDKTRQTFKEEHEDYVVFVLVHNPWASLKANEQYQWRLKNVAIDAGFEVSFPTIGYRRSLHHNAYYYQQLLKRFPNRKVIFLTHSVAALELRWMLEKSIDFKARPVGWLNLAGLLFGTSRTTSPGWIPQLRRAWFGEYFVPPHISRKQAYCYRALQWSEEELPMVSVLPFRPRSLYPLNEEINHHELDYWGPHDGYISLCDYLKVEHTVWPLWGETHQPDPEVMKTRLQATLMSFTDLQNTPYQEK